MSCLGADCRGEGVFEKLELLWLSDGVVAFVVSVAESGVDGTHLGVETLLGMSLCVRLWPLRGWLSSKVLGRASGLCDLAISWRGVVFARCGGGISDGAEGPLLTLIGLLDGAGRLRLTGVTELCRFFNNSGKFLNKHCDCGSAKCT